MRRRPGVPVGVVTAAIAPALLVGCSATGDRDSGGSGAGPTAPSDGPSAVLTEVPLPAGVAPVAVTSEGDRVLVGGRAAEGSPLRPRLYLGPEPDALTELPVSPWWPIAYEAEWMQLHLAADGQIAAIGGAPEGAHSNTRWSTWTGSVDGGVRELPQTFQTFGGWGAGALNSFVRSPGGELVVGSWQGSTGLDIAIWTRTDERWTRQPTPPDSPLASRADLLAAARHATARGAGVLAAGAVTELGSGTVTQRAAAWVTDAFGSAWSRLDLRTARTPAEAHAAACDPDRCTVVGHMAGELATWTVAPDGEVTAVDHFPGLAVDDDVLLPAPAVSADGAHVVLAATGDVGHVVELRRDGSVREHTYAAPGRPVSVARTASGATWVVHEAADGTTTLHTVRVT